jgi:hypothetical protein
MDAGVLLGITHAVQLLNSGGAFLILQIEPPAYLPKLNIILIEHILTS